MLLRSIFRHCLSFVLYLGSCMSLIEGFGSVLFMKGPSADAKNKHDWSGPRATLTGLSRRPLQRSPPLSHPKVRERTTGIMKAEMDLTTNWTPLWRSLSSPASSERTRVKVKDPVQQTTHLQQAFDRDIVHVAKLDPVPVLFTTEHLAGESDNATSPSVNVDLELMSIRHKLRLAVLRASRQPIASRLKKPRVGRRKRAPKG